jgi:adenine-specific DNA-methyltransferase
MGKRLLEQRDSKTLKENGQFLTPPAVARYMAQQLGKFPNQATLLEPAIGSGVLTCAVIDNLIKSNHPTEIWLDAYETDPELCLLCRDILSQACYVAEQVGIKIHWRLYQEDFILACFPETQLSLFKSNEEQQKTYDYIISNPPYFKLNHDDKRVKVVFGELKGHTNIYTLFMALSAKKLTPVGRACFIVPRSFCSGVYFSKFRRDLLKDSVPISVHLFQSRDEVFHSDNVLQENVVFTFKKADQPVARQYLSGFVTISTSKDQESLSSTQIYRQVSFKHFLGRRDMQLYFRLPTGILDEQLLDTIDRWEGSLEQLGLHVSTGPVVAFRAREYLRNVLPHNNNGLPLLWMQNILPYKVIWPLEKLDKPQIILPIDKTLLVPNSNYILLRRFSAKEDRRRLVAAPYLSDNYPYPAIGLENHLNYIYQKKFGLSATFVTGLAAILNCSLIDRYFRIVNGNTQVNAAELRALPLPPQKVIQQIGEKVCELQNLTMDTVDSVVYSVLWKNQLLTDDFPMFQETRYSMGKIEQAQEILEALGMPTAQQNEISALTLLVLAQLSEDIPWQNSTSINLRIHEILIAIKQTFGREYAENTRESIRRQVLHQFEQAGLVARNPDDPSLATNSPRTHYRLTELTISALRAYGTKNWETEQSNFINQRGALLELYQRTQDQNKVPLRVSDGSVFQLSPGKHNKLQALIIEEFGPRYAPGAKLLYIGDTARKTMIFEKDTFKQIGAPITDHGKLPDIVLFDEIKNWVYLIEAVTSHGPVSPKRQVELEELFNQCIAGRIYVSAFYNFSSFKQFIHDIAWETEVWIAEVPSHLIHFNGERFLGPIK